MQKNTVSLIVFIGLFTSVDTAIAQGNRLLTRGGGNDALEAIADWNVATKLSLENTIPRTPPQQSQCVAPDNIPIGAFGMVGCWNFEVGSITDKKNMLVNNGDHTYWIEGYPTNLLSTNEKIRILDPVQYVGMKDYLTVLGARKRVRHFKVMTKAEKIAADREQREKDSELWIVDEKELKARFVSYVSSVVTLENIDGEKTKYRIARFDETSAARIRELSKSASKKKK